MRPRAQQGYGTAAEAPATRATLLSVASSRTLVGAWAKVSTLQFFIAEAIVIAAWAGPQPYSRALDYISDLGALHCGVYRGRDVCSPLHLVMNLSFVLQGAGMLAGAILLSTAVFRVAGKPIPAASGADPLWVTLARVLIALAGVGIIVVGFVPEDLNYPLHYTGAATFFVAGGLSLLVIAWSWRRVSRASWAALACGLLSLTSTVIFAFGPGLDPGALERFMAYPITIGLAIVGLTMARGARRARTLLTVQA
jgi:hypothetical membrane protein